MSRTWGRSLYRAKSGDASDAARALERLVPVDILGLALGRLRYAFFTNARGGILDDVMVANRGDHLLIVVNAAYKATDEAHLRAELGNECEVERLDRALIALQGPKAETALAVLAPFRLSAPEVQSARGQAFLPRTRSRVRLANVLHLSPCRPH